MENYNEKYSNVLMLLLMSPVHLCVYHGRSIGNLKQQTIDTKILR